MLVNVSDTINFQILSLKKMAMAMIMAPHVQIGMLINHGVLMQRVKQMFGVHLNTNGATSVQLVRTLLRQFLSKVQNMKASLIGENAKRMIKAKVL